MLIELSKALCKMSYDTVTFREPTRIDRSVGYFTLPAFYILFQ